MSATLVARWQSRSGKHVVELFQDETGFFYRGDGCGGYLGQIGMDKALAEMERRVPDIQPNANRIPMRREA